MNDQRFVVEITRPVPPDKVAIVAERIAERLHLDLERIHTLLNGRVGPVTRPVLAEKADSIAEVFAEAGVRVIVVGAPSTVAEAEQAQPARATVDQPSPPLEAEQPPSQQRSSEHRDSELPEVEHQEPGRDDREQTGAEHRDYGSGLTTSVTSTPTWDPSVAWGDSAADLDQWQLAQEARQGVRQDDEQVDEQVDEHVHDAGQPHEAAASSGATATEEATGDRPSPLSVEAEKVPGSPHSEPATDDYGDGYGRPGYQKGAAAQPHQFNEEEADRLGPASSRTTPERMFTTSTRWMPSPHDSYGFDSDEEPYVPAEQEVDQAAAVQHDYFEPRGYEVPEWRGGPPRHAPALRTYLLWSLAASIVVLILLQVVFAGRGYSGSDQLDYEAGLRAYQQGDFSTAKRIWEPLATDGEERAQYQLGFMAQHGLGQPWSNARAANYYRRAAEAGLPEAQLALGDLHFRGLGVEQDARVAAQWYSRAADSGYPEAQYEYALLLMHGDGVAQQFEAALTWFEAAAAGGVERAADLVAFARSAVATALP